MEYERLSIEEIEDFTQRACVQLCPELTRMLLSISLELIEYKNKISENFYGPHHIPPWKMLNKIQPKEEKEYLCLAVGVHNNEIKHYILLRYWQNKDDKFNRKGFIDSGGNNIVGWCEIPEPPKNISLYDALRPYYEE